MSTAVDEQKMIAESNRDSWIARSGLISVALVACIAFVGAVLRRWIADDALIILRTVRNIEAGNGPVFNAGERVETSTSVLWQYVIWITHLVTSADLAAVAIWLGVLFGVIAFAVASLASLRTIQQASGDAKALVVPFGALVYLALPPARDFLTSGLEWSFTLCYLAVLYYALAVWGPRRRYLVAMICGLSWLVRPEMVLYGGAAGLALLIRHKGWADRAKIVGAGVALPLAYQVFRMGYYGLLVPHTAVAKSAADSMWGRGLDYLRDFTVPYSLWVPLLLVLVVILVRGREYWTAPATAFTVAAIAHALYVLRLGGDFMHARMLLIPLFAILLPVMLVRVDSLTRAAAAAGVTAWAVTVAAAGSEAYERWAEVHIDHTLGTVYEPSIWTRHTGREADDRLTRVEEFLPNPSLNGYQDAVSALASGDAFARLVNVDGERKWVTYPRENDDHPGTLYWVSLGYTAMNAPLEVRVLDPIGLASPLAARQPRVEVARVGHDKNLPVEWQMADSSVNLESADNPELARRAREALGAPEFQELFATYRDPLTPARYMKNIGFALTKGRTLTFSPDPATYGF